MDWEKTFFKQMAANSADAFRSALELKRQHLPARLYRYRPSSEPFYAIDEIKTGEIYCAHHSELNDPYDACSVMRQTSLSAYFGGDTKKQYAESFRVHFPESVLQNALQSDHWLEELMRLTAEKSAPPEQRDELACTLVQTVTQELLELNQAFNMVLHRIYRIVCFTTKPDNLPMWSHYASHHQGVCLEYDPARLSGTALQNFLFPVVYTPKLPDGIEFLQSARQGSKPAGITGILPFLLHKLQDWADEEEWRLLAHMELLCGTPGKLSETDWNTGHKLAFLRPSRVLLGFQIREDNEERIRQACELYGIPVVKMKLTEYGLREEQN